MPHLEAVCSACQTANPPANKFCRQCGGALTGGARSKRSITRLLHPRAPGGDRLSPETTRLLQAAVLIGKGVPVAIVRESTEESEETVPGANVTGVASVAGEAGAKQLALLHEALPKVSLVAVLWVGKSQPDAPVWSTLRTSGQQLGIDLHSIPVSGPASLQRTLGGLTKRPPGAVFVYADESAEVANAYLVTLGRFATQRRLPMASNTLALTWSGGLMSYSRDVQGEWGRTVTYVIQILEGARPADLPVQQPTQFKLVINLNTAKALGLAIPRSLLLRADQVIE